MALFQEGWWDNPANQGPGYRFFSSREAGSPMGNIGQNFLGITPGTAGGAVTVEPPSAQQVREQGAVNQFFSPTTPTGTTVQEMGRRNWYDLPAGVISPDVWANNAADLQLPAWAEGHFTDPQSFYTWYSNMADSEAFPGIQATMQSQTEARRRTEAARQGAIDRLGGTRGMFESELADFRSDPYRAQVFAGLEERSGADYRAISELEEAAALNAMGQEYARAQAQRLTSAGSRGAIGSGTTATSSTSLQGTFASGGQNVRANIAGQNQTARLSALDRLASFSGTTEQLEMGYLGAIAQIDQELARIESDVNYMPTDFMAFDAAAFAREAYASELGMAERELDLYEQSLAFSNRDMWEIGLALPGSGIPSMVRGALGNIFTPGGSGGNYVSEQTGGATPGFG